MTEDEFRRIENEVVSPAYACSGFEPAAPGSPWCSACKTTVRHGRTLSDLEKAERHCHVELERQLVDEVGRLRGWLEALVRLDGAAGALAKKALAGDLAP